MCLWRGLLVLTADLAINSSGLPRTFLCNCHLPINNDNIVNIERFFGKDVRSTRFFFFRSLLVQIIQGKCQGTQVSGAGNFVSVCQTKSKDGCQVQKIKNKKYLAFQVHKFKRAECSR